MATLMEFTGEDNQPREVSYQDPLPVSSSYSGRLVTKTVAFTGAAGLGAVGSVALFNVTGNVFAKVWAVCTENLASAGGGTLEVGVAGNTAALIAQTVATNIDAGEIWFDNTPIVGTTAVTNITERLIANGADIIGTVGTGDITDGTITWYCAFQPIGAGSSVVAA